MHGGVQLDRVQVSKTLAGDPQQTPALPGFAGLLPAVPQPSVTENPPQTKPVLEAEAAKILKSLTAHELCWLPYFNEEYSLIRKRAGEFALGDLSHHASLLKACVTLGKIHEYRRYEQDCLHHPVRNRIERAAFVRKEPDSLRDHDQSRSGRAIIALSLIAMAGVGIVAAATLGGPLAAAPIKTAVAIVFAGAGATAAVWIGFGNARLERSGRGAFLDRMNALKSELITLAYRIRPGSERHTRLMQLDLPFTELKSSESGKVNHHTNMLKDAIAKDPSRFDFTIEKLSRDYPFFSVIRERARGAESISGRQPSGGIISRSF